jgi:hypothetical protein
VTAIVFPAGTSTSDLSREKSIRIGDLGHSLRVTKQHLAGKLHDVYELNVLSPPHLDANIQGTTLGAWIKSGSRGELQKIKEGVFAWTVSEDVRPAVRSTLFNEGLLIATV